MSENLGVNLALVEKIINYQFSEVRAITGKVASIEMTGFATLRINQTKLKEIDKKYGYMLANIHKELERIDISDGRRHKLNLDVKLLTENLAYSKTKIRDYSIPRPKKVYESTRFVLLPNDNDDEEE